jgi:hypothetical protein
MTTTPPVALDLTLGGISRLAARQLDLSIE